MTIDEIKELIRLVDQAQIAEFKYEDDAVRVSIKKSSAFSAGVAAITHMPPQLAQLPIDTAANVAEAEASEQDGKPARPTNHKTVTAPMVGTFYRAPSPDAEPYIKVGDAVEVGQPLCIIEAMKLMNEIESEVAGRIVEILVENAQPIEYGQPLFIVETP